MGAMMSETSTEATTTDTTEATSTEAVAATEQATDWKAEAEKWKTTSRKHEDRAKANAGAAAELEKFRQSTLTDQEKAVEAAKAETRTQTLLEVGGHLVAAEFRAQAAGRLTPEQVAELVEDLDMSKYLTVNGEVDAERITRKVDALAPKVDTAQPFPDLGQGVRGGAPLALNSDGLTQALARAVGAPVNRSHQ